MFPLQILIAGKPPVSGRLAPAEDVRRHQYGDDRAGIGRASPKAVFDAQTMGDRWRREEGLAGDEAEQVASAAWRPRPRVDGVEPKRESTLDRSSPSTVPTANTD